MGGKLVLVLGLHIGTTPVEYFFSAGFFSASDFKNDKIVNDVNALYTSYQRQFLYRVDIYHQQPTAYFGTFASRMA